MSRRVQEEARVCDKCGRPEEIVAHGLCGQCYMRERRAAEREFVRPDRSQRKYLAQLNKDHGKLVGIVKLLYEVECLADDERQIIEARIKPHMLRLANALAGDPNPGDPQLTHNEPVTVNVNPGQGGAVAAREPGEETEPELEEAEPEFTVNGPVVVNVNSGQADEFTPEELEEG